MKSHKGMGFKAASQSIAQQLTKHGADAGNVKKRAGAILAASSRRASPAAKRKNKNLLKVRGKAK